METKEALEERLAKAKEESALIELKKKVELEEAKNKENKSIIRKFIKKITKGYL